MIKKEKMKEIENNCLSVYHKWHSHREKRKYAKQRAAKGFCKRDLYEINTWFLQIMPQMLRELNRVRCGYPIRICEEFYDLNKDRIPLNKWEFCNCHYDEYQELFDEASDWCDKRWNEILTKMAFLFDESDDEKCSQKNEFKEEYDKASKEFSTKYGFLGEKLMTEEEKASCEETLKKDKDYASCTVPHFMRELPEYREIDKKYEKRENEIYRYKQKCKKEALKMFVDYFNELWW